MSNIPKEFDAVEMMRSIRDSISKEIASMTLHEERQWFASQEFEDPMLLRLQKAGQPIETASEVANRR